MSVLDKELENYILQNEYYHHLFINVNKNQIELIKETIKKSSFFDLILEFDDYEKINNLTEDVPSDNSQRDYIIKRILQDYLYFKIIENAGISEYNIEDIKNCLYSGSLEEYTKIDVLMWMYIEDEIEKIAEKENKKARLHFFLDSVLDTKLQHKINDLYASRTKIVMMGYTTKNNLISYSSDIGGFIQDPHDYVTHNMKRLK